MKQVTFQNLKTVVSNQRIYYWYIQQETIRNASKAKFKKGYLLKVH
ncbi:MAG: hypothetical protein UR89_C0010G0008 [Candidatus Roizmanbacteria bacterium GW2011_GWA2_35_8]|uniref:Uncharacterized protein n=1 Tax=Candidatus Roizmanbacteria bacterium GW2011_GWA2_35_8 TaxID=1618479 RepID=A0A0G0G5B4_9BACT|nr:MAG: hypothetical protein UR89_C0010G0008 [Candidatus Roizmanbacteria bacterium GW2011_GWA2_35_8]